MVKSDIVPRISRLQCAESSPCLIIRISSLSQPRRLSVLDLRVGCIETQMPLVYIHAYPTRYRTFPVHKHTSRNFRCSQLLQLQHGLRLMPSYTRDLQLAPRSRAQSERPGAEVSVSCPMVKSKAKSLIARHTQTLCTAENSSGYEYEL